jgi:hypothetical protein
MNRVTCDFCGLPFRVRWLPPSGHGVYCCSGCALAAQMRLEGDQWPVTPQLVFNLGFGFAVFNQVLLWLIGLGLVRDGQAVLAARFGLGSIALGALVFAGSLVWQILQGWMRATDLAAYGAALAANGFGAWVLVHHGWTEAGACYLTASMALVAWQARGWIRKNLRRRAR